MMDILLTFFAGDEKDELKHPIKGASKSALAKWSSSSAYLNEEDGLCLREWMGRTE